MSPLPEGKCDPQNLDLPQLHIDMSLNSFSFVDFGIGGASLMATIFFR